MQETYYHQAPFGWIELKYQDDNLVYIDLSPPIVNQNHLLTSNKNLHQAFASHFKNFDPNNKPKHLLLGTEFQLNVWQALDTIPIGQTLTYGELAKKINSHPRAIGQALKRNPLPLLYPCHRVTSKTSIGGFAGETQGKLITIKKWLLNHETKIALNTELKSEANTGAQL